MLFFTVKLHPLCCQVQGNLIFAFKCLHICVCVLWYVQAVFYYATHQCHMLGRDHICARLVKYFPTFFVGLNCKCEELRLKQIAWFSPHYPHLTNWQHCVHCEDQEKKERRKGNSHPQSMRVNPTLSKTS